jgi:hypothetical protein
VNYVIDCRTFEEYIRGQSAKVDIHRDQPAGPAARSAQPTATPVPDDPKWRRCETASGTLVQPEEILAAMLVGYVRRVVYDAAGTVIDVARRNRIFTGNARDAVTLLVDRCTWPGCNIRINQCQADHTKPWSHGGLTAPSNGNALCPHHNRHKNLGFTTRRDHHGHWHTHRPDGTNLTDPPSPVALASAQGRTE